MNASRGRNTPAYATGFSSRPAPCGWCRTVARFVCTKSRLCGSAHGEGEWRRERGPGGRDRPGRATGWRSTGPGGSPLDRHPGRTHSTNYCVSATCGRRSSRNWRRFRTERPTVRRTRSPNSATASIRTARPPCGAGRLRPAAGPDTALRVRVLERAGAGMIREPSRGASTAPGPHPSGANTPHQSSKPAAARPCTSPGAIHTAAPASPRSSLARSEGRAGLPAVAPGQRGMASLPGRPACAAAASAARIRTPTPRETGRETAPARDTCARPGRA
jgi:hypothetical protein